MAKVICPHCGAENPKSLIVTTCQTCLQSLEGAQAPPDGPEAVPPTPPEPTVEAGQPEPVAPPPTEAPAPSWTPPPTVELPPRQPPQAPAPTEAPPAEPALPPVIEAQPPVYQPPPAAPTSDAVMRELKRSVQSGGQSRGCCIAVPVAIAVLIFAVVLIGVLATPSFGPGPLIPVIVVALLVLGALAVIAYFLGRAYVAASFYDLEMDTSPAGIGLGDTFTWGIVVRARRPLTVETVTVILKCQEHAIARGGTSDSHYRHTLHEETLQVPGRALHPGEEAPFRAAITVPPDAIPSHRSRNNFVEWTLEVRAAVPGYCPDIRDKMDLWVEPSVGSESTAGLPDDAGVPAAWLEAAPVQGGEAQLGRAWGTLQAQDGAAIDQTPVMTVGANRQFYLWVQTQEEVGCRGIWCWVGCRIHGRGTDEEIELLPEQQIHEGPLLPGQPIGYPIQVSVPASGPMTFVGRYVKLEWVARVRLDIPLWFDKRMWVPFIVTPRRRQAPGPD